jgi:hypothetical protein
MPFYSRVHICILRCGHVTRGLLPEPWCPEQGYLYTKVSRLSSVRQLAATHCGCSSGAMIEKNNLVQNSKTASRHDDPPYHLGAEGEI